MKHLFWKFTPFCIIITLLFLSFLLFGCCQKQNIKKQAAYLDHRIGKPLDHDENDLEELSKYLKDTVRLEYLLDGILIPERMKTICKLNTIDKGNGWYIYKNGKYNFSLHVTGDDSFNETINNSVFYDGKFKIEFKGKKILRSDPNSTENYGINQLTRLVDPRIVQVGTETFLFSPLTFNCNGIGCGILTYFIYHLQTHKASFINDSHYYISSPLLGDFNLDNIPDILVIEEETIPEIKPFNVSGFQVRLLYFEFDKGSFQPKTDPVNHSPVSYTLTGLGNSEHEGKYRYPVSVTEDKWHRF